MSSTLHLAYSPCPNDTALFGPITCGQLTLSDILVETHLHDIENLNRHAMQGRYDITKLSVYGYLKARQHYRLLDVGAAFGFGCGPLLVTGQDKTPDLSSCRILFPGEHTTYTSSSPVSPLSVTGFLKTSPERILV